LWLPDQIPNCLKEEVRGEESKSEGKKLGIGDILKSGESGLQDLPKENGIGKEKASDDQEKKWGTAGEKSARMAAVMHKVWLSLPGLQKPD
jgi:hypothetical protein